MLYFTAILLACLTSTRSQLTTVSPDVLEEIFGPPPITNAPITTSPRLEDITVKPTDSNTVYETSDGEECKCVPYYLCDENRNVVHITNASVTGWMELDIRFGEDRKCQESVELCCKMPRDTPVEVPRNPNANKGCGYRNPNGLDFSITGGSGTEAGFGEYPWVVALTDAANQYVGVGVLVHPSVVMTGAHVIFGHNPSQLKIRAGEWDTQTTKERLPHQERSVEEMYLHEDFNNKTLYDDIALLRLNEPVQIADHVNVICLPEQDMDFDSSKNCVANGWGKSVFGVPGRYAVILKKVEIDMVARDQCLNMLRRTRLGSKFNLHSSFVCAGGEQGKDTCKGDGGAPLACPIGDERYSLTGLVAWGIGCNERDVPGVYTRVSMFRRWVDAKLGQWGYFII